MTTKSKSRIFIVAPTGADLSDKLHHICQTTKRDSIDAVYNRDDFEIIGDRLSLAAAKRFALRHGAKRPKVI